MRRESGSEDLCNLQVANWGLEGCEYACHSALFQFSICHENVNWLYLTGQRP